MPDEFCLTPSDLVIDGRDLLRVHLGTITRFTRQADLG